MNYVIHQLSSADISIFSPEIDKCCYINKYSYRFHFQYMTSNSFNSVDSLKNVLVNLVTILMLSAKIVTLTLLKIKLFSNNSYGVINSGHDVTNKTLSCDSNYIVGVFMRQKIGNFSIFMRENIITSILLGFDQKNHLF